MGKFIVEIKWALIFILASLVWMIFERMVGLHGEHIDKHPIYTNFFSIIAFVIYYLALKEKREKVLGGKMSWTQGLVSGIIISVVVFIFTPLSQWLTHNVISPDYFANAIEYSVTELGKERVEMEKYFSFRNYLFQSAIGAIVFGTLTAAIIAIITKKS